MNSRASGFGALIASFLVFYGGLVADAQVIRYQPRTSTVSPYLNLGRFNGGGLPNYYALVRPQIQQRQFNLQAEAVSHAQESEIGRIQSELQQGLTPTGATGTGSWFMTPGTQSGFLNTSRYYPEPHRGGGFR